MNSTQTRSRSPDGNHHLILLRPIIVNIVLFHVFMDRNGMPMALVIAVLSLFLLNRYWSSFAALLRA